MGVLPVKTLIGMMEIIISAAARADDAVHAFGAQEVQAISSVVSVFALVAATWATIVYVKRTADIARATRSNAEQQARLADLMLQDLLFRTRPHLRFLLDNCRVHSNSNYVSAKVELANESPATAIVKSVRVKLRCSVTLTEFDLYMPKRVAMTPYGLGPGAVNQEEATAIRTLPGHSHEGGCKFEYCAEIIYCDVFEKREWNLTSPWVGEDLLTQTLGS